MSIPSFDVLGLGVTAIDDLVYVAEYPPADTKVRVLRRQRQCGGLTATALVAASRLGSRCMFAGVLGEDELSQFVLQRFLKEQIDATLVRSRAEARPVHATIVVDETHHTRTIFSDLTGAFGPDIDWPDEDVIRAARVLFVDHFGIEGMIRASRVARAADIPVVADFESDQHERFGELLALVDHLILSRDFATRITGSRDPAAAAGRLWAPARQVVVVTCGREGCWYLTADGPESPCHQPIFPVAVVDTTGCGDVFHGAYASALARGLGTAERIRFAAAAAALKAMHPGGQTGIPTRAAVEEFMA